ncbi:hypothetical protein MMC29_005295 [Sticta canariensis]|nr:hypothetical protein [Sticta canariensis]
MLPAIFYFCIVSLTIALALPIWEHVAKPPQTLFPFRVGASTAPDLGEQGLLSGGWFLPRRSQQISHPNHKRSVEPCRDNWYQFDEFCSIFTPEEQENIENSYSDDIFTSMQTGYNAR